MKSLFLLLLTFALISCAEHNEKTETPDDHTMDIQAELASIDKTRQTFMIAVKENDGEAIGSVVTADLKAIYPGSSEWKEMYIESDNRGPFPYDSIVIYPIETVIVSDNTAYDFGISHVYYTNREGDMVELKNSFLAILKKGRDGSWKLHREVASANLPDLQ